MKNQKKALRSEIKFLKQGYSKEDLDGYSKEIMKLLCYEPSMAQAETVLLYYSLPDEVDTHSFVKYWSKFKKIILPVVVGDDLELRVYSGEQDLKQGSYGIWEPCGTLFTDYKEIDLVIVPGIAFDDSGNRIGRGKGYYDKLLPKIEAYKMGICFPFQYLVDRIIPTEETDIQMDKVLTLTHYPEEII
ncbi:5-formyltetrahydrofolate cyclo-ligase [Bacteroides coprosuis]|uniref:5-formyltetrahydrofolate cyclo-ligase n=1 Tax=Bacteroides coprosuis TaxID=151276 RepID=UPI001D67695B|nr:5-formyltetrahydrofolate cyclo-ligase [Bacteroides coprosuis]HJD92078.1 5-formyltetrahydrofolate cyclo-ligase [Bacteroides coprosuis]